MCENGKTNCSPMFRRWRGKWKGRGGGIGRLELFGRRLQNESVFRLFETEVGEVREAWRVGEADRLEKTLERIVSRNFLGEWVHVVGWGGWGEVAVLGKLWNRILFCDCFEDGMGECLAAIQYTGFQH